MAICEFPLKTLHFKRLCLTLACTTPGPGGRGGSSQFGGVDDVAQITVKSHILYDVRNGPRNHACDIIMFSGGYL